MGERFSIVFFTCGGYRNAKSVVQSRVVKCGARWPSEKTMGYFKRKLPVPQGYERLGEQLPPRKRKALDAPHPEKPKAKNLNTLGDKFKLLNFPHLHMGLTVGNIYSTASLVKKCRGDRGRLAALLVLLK